MVEKKQEKESYANDAQIVYHTPTYSPDHVLSPEFEGKSNYEMGIRDLINNSNHKLHKLVNDKSPSHQIHNVVEDIKTLNCLYENYYIGMNVFRNAKGGRDKLRV